MNYPDRHFPSSFCALGRTLAVMLLILLGNRFHMPAQEAVSRLRVLEVKMKAPIPMARVSLGSTRGFVSDAEGYVRLPKEISSEQIVEVSCMGYKTYKGKIGKLPISKGSYVVYLSEHASRLEEQIVIASRPVTSRTAVAAHINTDEIQKQAGRSLAELLEGISGVSSIKNGVGASKPVIHGMHGSRILIVNNGVRQSGQQWGESHAPEVDMSSSHAIHVVKGAEGVRYGSEAMGGIILMEQKTLPYGSSQISGNFSGQYGTNGRQFVEQLSLEGSLPKAKRWGWRLQGLYSNGGDRSTANYLLNNTGTRELNLTASVGYKAERLSVEGFYSRFDSRHGILRSSEMSNINILRERLQMGRPHPDDVTAFSRGIASPNEHVVHHTLTGKIKYRTPFWGEFQYQVSYQRDNRREYRLRRVGNGSIPDVDLVLGSLQHRLQWEKKWSRWQTEVGTQYISTDNYSVPGTGVTPSIPNYTEQVWGAYIIQKYHGSQRLNLEAGIRLDGQDTHASGIDYLGRSYGGSRHFFNMSYNFGARYALSRSISATSNLGIAWRAPHVYELYASGADHGSVAYVQGDSTLLSEQSYKWITSLVYRHKVVSLYLDAYLQWINNYIYDEPLKDSNGEAEMRTTISGAYPIFQYKQTSAWIRGIDLTLELQPLSELSYKATTALIFANERKTGNYLPYIPSWTIDHFVRYAPRLGSERIKSHIQIGHKFVDKQRRFDPSRDLVDYTPGAYNLVSAEVGLDYRLRSGRKLSCAISVDNLFNVEYKEYTNRARYYSHDLGRDIRFWVSWQF